MNDIHLIHHLVTEELDKVGIGDVEGGIFAMLRMKVFPDKDMCVFGRGCSQARSSGAIPLEGHVGLRRWYLRPLGRAPVWVASSGASRGQRSAGVAVPRLSQRQCAVGEWPCGVVCFVPWPMRRPLCLEGFPECAHVSSRKGYIRLAL